MKRCFFCLTVYFLANFLFYYSVQAQRLSLPSLPITGVNDTIPFPISLFDGEWTLYANLPEVNIRTGISLDKYKQWLRLKRAVKKVFPYAKGAGKVILEIRRDMNTLATKKEKNQYLRFRQEELLTTFTTPMKKLSRYQGRILIKMINRESGNSCYELLKDNKGVFVANFWETVAGLFSNTLKEKYEPEENLDDYKIELMVRELEANTLY